MSASEKLKALEASGNVMSDLGASLKLSDALPQIVAVVSAAESVTSADEGAWHGSRLLRALTALEETLS